jgi:hypothetical protein
VKYEIEIELPPEIAAEWEPVRFGVPQPGEHYVRCDTDTEVGAAVTKWRPVGGSFRLIVRRRHSWPQWMRDMCAKWAALDKDGTAWLYTARPTQGSGQWFVSGGAWSVDASMLPPHDGKPWTECLWEVQ